MAKPRKIPKPSRDAGGGTTASATEKAAAKKGKKKPGKKGSGKAGTGKGKKPRAPAKGRAMTPDERSLVKTFLRNKKVVTTTTPLPVGLKDALKVVAKAEGVTLRVLMVTVLREKVDRALEK